MVPGRDAPSPSVGPLLSADVQGWLETALRSDSDEDPEGELFDRELVRGRGELSAEEPMRKTRSVSTETLCIMRRCV